MNKIVFASVFTLLPAFSAYASAPRMLSCIGLVKEKNCYGAKRIHVYPDGAGGVSKAMLYESDANSSQTWQAGLASANANRWIVTGSNSKGAQLQLEVNPKLSATFTAPEPRCLPESFLGMKGHPAVANFTAVYTPAYGEKRDVHVRDFKMVCSFKARP